MRALTIKPHFAHAIAFLAKRIENRAKPIPPALLGERIAIHAGASLPAGWANQLREACPTGPNRLPLIVGGVSQTAQFEGEPDRCIHMRGIVATAVLARCIESNRAPAAFRSKPWADPGAVWWWTLEGVRVLTSPVHVERGQLGLWRLDDRVEYLIASTPHRVIDGV